MAGTCVYHRGPSVRPGMRPIIITTVSGGRVELDPGHIIGLRELQLPGKEGLLLCCELLVTGGYAGIVMTGGIDDVRSRLRAVAQADEKRRIVQPSAPIPRIRS